MPLGYFLFADIDDSGELSQVDGRSQLNHGSSNVSVLHTLLTCLNALGHF